MRNRWAWAAIAAGVVAALGGIAVGGGLPARTAASATELAQVQPRQVPSSRQEIQLSYAPIVKRVAPAVVNVYASRQVASRPVSPFFNDPFFQRFFGDQGGRPSRRIQQSLGSGVIVDPAGIIVTNNHVIAGADEIKVALADGREFTCDIMAKDERADLAVLRLKGLQGGDLESLEFADSDLVEVGDLVLAVGDPFGVGQTVTSGIISALARSQISPNDQKVYLQTDAAINPGNSGGALVNMEGRLIGINTAIYSPSGGSAGIGFAIPSNMVRLVVASARSGQRMQRPWIGAQFQAVTSDIATSLGIERPRGALVIDVAPGSPAAAADLEVSDLVLAVDGVDIADPAALTYRLTTTGVGNNAVFTVLRNGRQHQLKVKLTAAPETVPRDERKIGGRSPFSGITVANLSPAVAEEYGVQPGETGVLITDVATGTPAAQVGLAVGDIVLDVNGEAVDNTGTMQELAAGEARLWRFSINRNGRVLPTVIGTW
jgi:Do/DeqQ family serine protease